MGARCRRSRFRSRANDVSDAPSFWFADRGALAHALVPAAALYGRIAGSRMAATPKGEVEAPVICIGNYIVGGAGKTPVALEIARIAAGTGRRPGFLSRGYRGAAPMPLVVDPQRHTSRDVGDEPLMLAARHPTVVSPDRVKGARLLLEQDVDLVVMDDGLQNPGLLKDYSIAVVGARRGIGNGLVMPAGPLRAALGAQLALTDAVAVVGQPGVADHPSAREIVRRAAKRALPILRGQVLAVDGGRLADRKVLAFAGIGDPEKFFRTVESTGATIAHRTAFDDHRVYDPDTIGELLTRADRDDLTLVTTEKDAARLRGTGAKADELAARAAVLEVRLLFDDEGHVRRLIGNAITRARERRLRR